MRYLKYFNQINEGHITLTADEHKAVERVRILHIHQERKSKNPVINLIY